MLTVVGMGPAGRHLMTPAALEAIDHADALAGGKRHLAQFPAFGGERFTLGADIGALLSWISSVILPRYGCLMRIVSALPAAISIFSPAKRQ
ncbi:hypothetical protein ACEXT9_001424 [Salmonella enterica]|nr:hypothetical protein [Salmonella enterica]